MVIFQRLTTFVFVPMIADVLYMFLCNSQVLVMTGESLKAFTILLKLE